MAAIGVRRYDADGKLSIGGEFFPHPWWQGALIEWNEQKNRQRVNNLMLWTVSNHKKRVGRGKTLFRNLRGTGEKAFPRKQTPILSGLKKKPIRGWEG